MLMKEEVRPEAVASVTDRNREVNFMQGPRFLAWVIVQIKNQGGRTGMSGWKEHTCLVWNLMVLIILSLFIQPTITVEPSEFWPFFHVGFLLEVTEGKREASFIPLVRNQIVN